MSADHGELKLDLRDARRSNGEIAVCELSVQQWGMGGWVDVVSMKPSWSTPNPTAYEVKATRSDFQRDVQRGKYRNYLPYFCRFYFATPSGLVSKDEVPEGCGLIVRGENGWHGVVGPRVREVEGEAWTQLLHALLLRQKDAPWRVKEDSRALRAARIRRYGEHRELRKVLAEDTASALRTADQKARHHEHARKHLARALGRDDPGDATVRELARDLVKREATGHEVRERIATEVGWKMDHVERAVTRLREELDAIANGAGE